MSRMGVNYWGGRRPAEERRSAALENKRETTPEGCWLWTGSAMSNGYGQYRTMTENLLVHRMAYEMLVGPIPEGKVLHHICERRLCFNPDHLEPVERAEHLKMHGVTRWA